MVFDKEQEVPYRMPSFLAGQQGGKPAEMENQRMGVILRISSSIIGMDSARSYTSVTRKASGFSSQTYAGILERREGSLTFRGALLGKEEEEAKAEKENKGNGELSLQNQFRSVGITKISSRDEMEALNRIRQHCIQYLMELFGLYKRGTASRNMTEMSGMTPADSGTAASVSTTVVSGMVSESYMEEENTAFRTTGSVVTADGRTIEFNLEMEMSRRFQSVYEQSYETVYRNVDTCDPLVINLDNNIASVSDQKFLFDIDGDGILDRVSELNAGSGYLALDKNGDGKINDGTELFGPESGNGFADLAKYDDDGNGWIDEDDEIWDKLLIWTKDENGKDQLYHISEKGIGAICLQNQSTSFSLNSLRDNQTNGIIRSTGIFLYENGNVGTIQHVDLAK